MSKIILNDKAVDVDNMDPFLDTEAQSFHNAPILHKIEFSDNSIAPTANNIIETIIINQVIQMVKIIIGLMKRLTSTEIMLRIINGLQDLLKLITSIL